MDDLPRKLDAAPAPFTLSPSIVADLYRQPLPTERELQIFNSADKTPKKLELQPADTTPKLSVGVAPNLSLGLSFTQSTPNVPGGIDRFGRSALGFDNVDPLPNRNRDTRSNLFNGAMIHFQARF
jgi:hypothetical protein